MSFSYAVVRVGEIWKVVCARKAMGFFDTPETALSAAQSLAREAAGAGHPAEVLVQSETGELKPVYFQQL